MTTVRPELKRMHSPDIFDLDHAKISESEPFCVLIQAMFGSVGADGEESFDVLVCNPLWVEEEARRGAFSGRHHLIVARFDINEIRAFLQNAAVESAGEPWDEVARKLARVGKWEFEDYVEYQTKIDHIKSVLRRYF